MFDQQPIGEMLTLLNKMQAHAENSQMKFLSFLLNIVEDEMRIICETKKYDKHIHS
jgi:hypothetical protein